MELCLQGLHQLSVDMWKMTDELPAALEYTLSTTHHLSILSPPEQKIGQPHAKAGDGKGEMRTGDEGGPSGKSSGCQPGRAEMWRTIAEGSGPSAQASSALATGSGFAKTL